MSFVSCSLSAKEFKSSPKIVWSGSSRYMAGLLLATNSQDGLEALS